MTTVHFKTVQEFPLVAEGLMRVRSQVYFPTHSEPDTCAQLFALLTKLINEPNTIFAMGFQPGKEAGQTGGVVHRFSDQLQVEHNPPVLKLRHRTSIEDAIL